MTQAEEEGEPHKGSLSVEIQKSFRNKRRTYESTESYCDYS